MLRPGFKSRFTCILFIQKNVYYAPHYVLGIGVMGVVGSLEVLWWRKLFQSCFIFYYTVAGKYFRYFPWYFLKIRILM